MPLGPTRAQLEALAAGPDGPVVMLNLLRYATAAPDDGPVGAARYARYGQRVQPLLARAGAEVLWQGSVDGVFIGGDADRDAALADSRLIVTTERFRAG